MARTAPDECAVNGSGDLAGVGVLAMHRLAEPALGLFSDAYRRDATDQG
jgi:hypothetical protein